MPKKKVEPLKGICYWHVDIDSVGWCFMDSKFMHPDKLWSYEGIHCLKDGDKLKVFSKEDNSVLFDDVINLASNEGHGVSQKDIPLKTWAQWFSKEYPAELIPAKIKSQKKKK